MLSAAPALADEPKRPTPFAPAEIAFTAGNGLQVLSALTIYESPKRNWEGGILFDDAVRNSIRLPSRSARLAAGTTSDMLYYALLTLPLLDVPITALARNEEDLTMRVLAMNLESFSLAGAIALSAEKAGRARPMTAECAEDPGYDPKCGSDEHLNASFLSGHTTIAYAGAGLLCVHHLEARIYGGTADWVTCIGGLTGATAAGVLRIMSDNHYASDVLLGAAVGLGSGWLLPRLLHYRGVRVEPSLAPSTFGLVVTSAM